MARRLVKTTKSWNRKLSKEERRVLNYIKKASKVYESTLLKKLRTTKSTINSLLSKRLLSKSFDKSRKPYYVWEASAEEYKKYYAQKARRAYLKTGGQKPYLYNPKTREYSRVRGFNLNTGFTVQKQIKKKKKSKTYKKYKPMTKQELKKRQKNLIKMFEKQTRKKR